MKTQQKLIDVLAERVERAEAKLEKAESYAKGLSAVLEKAEVDNRTLLEQLEKAEAELEDIRDAHVKVMSEQCPTDEVHCTCVPILKREIQVRARGPNNYDPFLKEIIESCPTCSGKMQEN